MSCSNCKKPSPCLNQKFIGKVVLYYNDNTSGSFTYTFNCRPSASSCTLPDKDKYNEAYRAAMKKYVAKQKSNKLNKSLPVTRIFATVSTSQNGCSQCACNGIEDCGCSSGTSVNSCGNGCYYCSS